MRTKLRHLLVIAALLAFAVILVQSAIQRQKAKPTMSPEMNETDKYILNAIHKWVWSGFYSPEEVDHMIDDILEDDANETMLRDAVDPEFSKFEEAQSTWPKVTDCDRLKAVFAALDKRGVLCLDNAGYELSDGHTEAFEVLSKQPGQKYFGYCFYHGQDVEGALAGYGLHLAFEHIDHNSSDTLKVGTLVREELERASIPLEWNGTSCMRIYLPKFDWKNRR